VTLSDFFYLMWLSDQAQKPRRFARHYIAYCKEIEPQRFA